MVKRQSFGIVLALSLGLSGCTHSGEVYDSRKHAKEEYSKGRTAAAVVGTLAAVAAVVAVAANDGGGYYPPTDYDYAWDFQPQNGQWVCRGIQTGRYAYASNCAYDPVHDFTWPG